MPEEVQVKPGLKDNVATYTIPGVDPRLGEYYNTAIGFTTSCFTRTNWSPPGNHSRGNVITPLTDAWSVDPVTIHVPDII